METDSLPPPPEQSPTSTVDAAELRAKLDQLEQQVADYKLLIADFENARRRQLQDAERQRKYAQEPLARDLLTGIDNLERAVEAALTSGDSAELVKGVKATLALFLDILKRHGVQRIEAVAGKPFDPSIHEAVMEQPTNDHPPGSIVQVVQPGFTLHDRLLRPAHVVVAAEPPAGE